MPAHWSVWLVFLLLGQEAPPQTLPAEEVRTSFRKLLDRPKVPLDVRVGEIKPDDAKREVGYSTEYLSFATEAKADGTTERVPTMIVRPNPVSGRIPAVIVLHGTGGTKEGQKAFLQDLAKRGMMGVAIDARYHGERAGGVKGADAYNRAIIRAWKAKSGEPQEHPFYYDTCWDIWRTIDYLQTRSDVDPGRIGMIGFSMGGIETWLAGAVDDRVKVAIPAISVQSFRWSLDHDRWQGRARTIKAAHDAAAADQGEKEVNAQVCRALWDKIIPGILGPYDCPSMMRLFAGRPLLILNGENDPNCPLPGAELAFAAAREAYRRDGTIDRLMIMVAKDTGHSVTPQQRRAALDWLDQWLKRR